MIQSIKKATYLFIKIESDGTDVLSEVLASDVCGFFSLSVERTLTLPHTEGQQPRGPVRRIAAHLTGSSSRRSSLSSRSKDKP